MTLNPELLKLAHYTVGRRQKFAFQPPMDPPQMGGPPPDPSQAGGMPPDPSQMGGPPPDPSQAGGMPPPPMDPSQAGGMPPPDPSQMGGPPPDQSGGANPLDAILMKLDQLSQAMQMAPQNQSGPGGAPGGPGKPGKPDLLAMSMDIFQIKKMLTVILNAMGIPMPQDIIDGPNRDPQTGAPMPPNAPGSTSDPNRQPEQGAPAPSPDSSIKPIDAMKGAFPSAGGSSPEKIGEQVSIKAGKNVRNKAAALAAVLRRKKVNAS